MEVSATGTFSVNDFKVAEQCLIRDAQKAVTEAEIDFLEMSYSEGCLQVRSTSNSLQAASNDNSSNLSAQSDSPAHLGNPQMTCLSKICQTLNTLRHHFGSLRKGSCPKDDQPSLHELSTLACATTSIPNVSTITNSNVGLDYFGPIHVKSKCNEEKAKGGTKRWIGLFTCQWSRASAFLLSLRRFITRRDQPRSILFDNASTFLLAEKATDQILNQIQCIYIYILEKELPGKMAFTKADHKALRRMIGGALVYDELLQTLPSECEAIVNSRPLTHCSSTKHYRPSTK
ncbi:unnamed protein product [Toxocara canis]|uniref:Integrase catalytic domain-containing protein n=1 Tax=Toxocara canis TaxID=6265 RepID=A0A183VEE1_TOXCA|nr:unnamed protein product [Toxocara canis]